jgi:4-hydroxy-tetrahydrodipicolinate reductase
MSNTRIHNQDNPGKKPIRVVVSGAKGKMGLALLKTLAKTPHIQLVGAVTRTVSGQETVRDLLGTTASHQSIPIETSLREVLQREKPDVCVDLTCPDVVFENTMTIIETGCRPVIGTTGLSAEQLDSLRQVLLNHQLGGMVIPNFAIGAVLMMKFAQMASQYFDHAEIIELHHNQKADAPSGTALKTAEMMRDAIKNPDGNARFGATNAAEHEQLVGARGATIGDSNIHIHSIRLPGHLAHQEVLFGSPGQRLSIRHDTMDRDCFMSGVVLCIEKVMLLEGLTYGLENLL